MALYYHTAYDAAALQHDPPTMTPTELFADFAPKQPSTASQRQSRGANRHRPQPMRVSKANSANNSPRESVSTRRRTLMSDAPQHVLAMTARQVAPNNTMHNHHNRPISWHPSSQVSGNMAYAVEYATPNAVASQVVDGNGVSSASFAQYASPTYPSSQSPQHIGGPQPRNMDFYSTTTSSNPSTYGALHEYLARQQESLHKRLGREFDNMFPPTDAQLGWNTLAATGYAGVDTNPPTPESFLPLQPASSLTADDNIPYHALAETETDGEVLVGMGLYDAPDKATSPDTQLENYRALMMSQVLGISARREEPRRGKGLKLEETWNPPGSDDEDEDAESEEDLELQPHAAALAVDTVSTPAQLAAAANFAAYSTMGPGAFAHGSDISVGWI